jgi:hypothetical protein
MERNAATAGSDRGTTGEAEVGDEHTPKYDSHVRLRQTQQEAMASAEHILHAVRSLPLRHKKVAR